MKWHGWKLRDSDEDLYVGRMPGRKSVALYSIKGSVVTVHAYFRTEDDARRVMRFIDSLCVALTGVSHDSARSSS